MERSPHASPALAALDAGGMTRASFLVRATVAAGAALGAGAVGPFVSQALAQEATGDRDILNYLLSLEHLEKALFDQALRGGPSLSGRTRTRLEVLADHERAHVRDLTALVRDLGGRPAVEPAATFAAALGTRRTVLRTTRDMEDLVVAAYVSALTQMEAPTALARAARIFGTEARHAAAVRLLIRDSAAPSTFDDSLDRDEVRQRLRPYVESL